MSKYFVVKKDANLLLFCQTQIGSVMFNGDNFFGGGRILNCKKKSECLKSDYDYYLAADVYVVLATYENEEEAVVSANLDIVKIFEKSEDFLTEYSNG